MCTVNLRTDISPTSDPGGQWFYLGYSTDPSGPFGSGPANPLVSTPISGVLSGGDNPLLNTAGVDEGFYRFSYTVGLSPCNDTNIVDVEVLNVECAGGNKTTILCKGASSPLMTSLLSSTPCAPIIGTLSTFSGPTDPVYTGSGQRTVFSTTSQEGTYVIRNTHASTAEYDTLAGCDSCSSFADATVELRTPITIAEITPPIVDIFCDTGIPGDCEVNLRDLITITPDTSIYSELGTWRYRGKTTLDGNTNGPAEVNINIKATGSGVPSGLNGVFANYGVTSNNLISLNDTNVLVDFSMASDAHIYRFEYLTYSNATGTNTSTCGAIYIIDIRLNFAECELPCDGLVSNGDYVTDLNTATLALEYMTDPSGIDAFVVSRHLISFKLNNVEQLGATISLGAANFITLNSLPYLTNIVDVLNSLAYSGFTFSYSTAVDSNGTQRYININAPDYQLGPCPKWEFTIGDPSFQSTWQKFEQGSMAYGFNGTSYFRVTDAIVGGTSSQWTPTVGDYLLPPIQNFIQTSDC